ncbi:MAG: hypothetical protein FJZ75_10645 [Bacteroidetes bacterium]|nr:hypothetical protein [Bacteroidota bacterium]
MRLEASKTLFWAWVLPLAAVLLLYWPLPIHLNQVLFSYWSDADRAFRVYAEFALGQASGYWMEAWFFPFGEHLFYLDANPLLCWFSAGFFSLFPSLRPYMVGVFNGLVLAQLLFTHVGWFRVGRYKSMPAMPAAVLALALSLLAPQWLKNNGNFSLAYTALFPYLCLALLKWTEQSNSLRPILTASFWVALSVLIHPYLGLVNGSFALLWVLLAKPFKLKNWFRALLLAVPLLLFVVVLKWSDPASAYRTQEPWGATDNQMSLAQWLIPGVGHVNEWLTKWVGDAGSSQAWEFAFIPWSVWGALLWVLILGYGKFLFKALPKSAVFAGLVLLLFASGLFGLSRFSWLFEVVPYLKQFRYVLRFAWPMYGVLGFSVGLAFYSALKNTTPRWRSLLLVLVLMPAGIEAHGHLRFLTDIHLKTPNLYSESHQSAEFKAALRVLQAEKPAALLTEPFLFEGSLMTAGENPVELRRLAYVLSVLGKVPTVGGILIRPNENQALASSGFSSEPWYRPSPYFQRALKGKTLALLFPKDLDWSQARWSHRKPYKVVAVDSTYRLGLIKAEDWMRVLSIPIRSESDSVHINLLADENYRDAPPFGNKAKQISRSEYHVLLDTLGLNAEDYEASLWVDARRGNSVNGVLFVEEVNEQGQGQWIAQANPARSRCLDGGWARCSLSFAARSCMRYRIILTAYDFQANAFGLNRFMLRPLDIEVGGVFGAYRMWNNHWQKIP